MKSIYPKEIIDYSAEKHFDSFGSATKTVYLSIILLLVVGLAVLPFVKISITQQGRGVIRTLNEKNTVTAAIHGQVEENRLFENLMVEVGDTLIVLRTIKLEQELNALNKKLQLNTAYQDDLKSLQNGKKLSFKTLLYNNEFAEYNQKLTELNTKIRRTKEKYTINKSLFEKEVIAQLDFEEIEHLYKQALQDKKLYQKQKKLQWQNRLEEIVLELLEIDVRKAQIEKEKENYVVRAPVSGSITSYSGIQAGNFLTPNQTIAHISPDGDLIVECYVSPKDIGYIEPNMVVAFQFDTFNYNQWGVGGGKVVDISPDIFQNESQSFFKVRCSLNQNHLVLKNGYMGKLKKGMTLTARFKVTDRTLFQLLYDKVDDWLNPRLKS